MAWRDSLTTNGYVVIPCLNEDQVAYGKSLFDSWWDANVMARKGVVPHGVLKHYRIGHTGFAWWCRTRPEVQAVFAELWGTPDLVVSFDGVCYFPPGLRRRNTNWLDVDQAPNNPHFDCVQGFVAFTENSEACLTLVPNSHLLFAGYMQSRGLNHANNWQRVEWDLQDTIKVATKPGDLVLWDSRIFHQNSYGAEERLVQYLCYLPRHRATASDLVKRVRYFQEKRTTSHWPIRIRVNGLQPQVFGKKEKLIDYDSVVDPGAHLLQELAHEINILL